MSEVVRNVTFGNIMSMVTTLLASAGVLVGVTLYIGEIRSEMREFRATHAQRLDSLEREQRAFVAQDKADREILWEIRSDMKHLKLLLDQQPKLPIPIR